VVMARVGLVDLADMDVTQRLQGHGKVLEWRDRAAFRLLEEVHAHLAHHADMQRLETRSLISEEKHMIRNPCTHMQTCSIIISPFHFFSLMNFSLTNLINATRVFRKALKRP
jgi:hypothetical protein